MMINRVNERVKDLEVPGIRVFSNEVMQYKDGVNRGHLANGTFLHQNGLSKQELMRFRIT